MITRIYVVINGEGHRLVDAASAAQAIRHCVKNKYATKAATPKDIAQYMSAGVVIEKAADDGLIPTQVHDALAQNQPNQPNQQSQQ